MSRTKLLLDVAHGLRTLADSVAAMADAMVDGDVSAQESASVPGPAASIVTLEQVRAVLADASRAGKTAEVKALLERFGADRLSAIDPAQFSELLIAAEEL